ncbi:unnamed protein product, partial [Prorocentrum cordatum]
DLGRRAVCLLESDGLVRCVPLVGVWVDLAGGHREGQATPAACWDASGVVDSPLVWAAAARFVHSPHVGERVWIEDATFLVMIVHRCTPHGPGGAAASASASFFEAKYACPAAKGALVAPAGEPLTLDTSGVAEPPRQLSCALLQ